MTSAARQHRRRERRDAAMLDISGDLDLSVESYLETLHELFFIARGYGIIQAIRDVESANSGAFKDVSNRDLKVLVLVILLVFDDLIGDKENCTRTAFGYEKQRHSTKLPHPSSSHPRGLDILKDNFDHITVNASGHGSRIRNPLRNQPDSSLVHNAAFESLPSKDSQRSPRSPAWTEREQPILPSPCSPIPSTSASTIATPVITTAQSPLPYPPNYERTREHIPRFYFPRGRPSATNTTASTLMKIEHIFERLPNQRALRHDMPEIVQALGIPLYWKYPLFLACKDPSSSDEDGITLPQFKRAWQLICADCHDQAARFVRILTMHDAPAVDVQHAALREQHFVSLVQDICESHPGLSFLRDATEFHPRYVETVISRIFFSCQQPWLGRITVELLRRSNFLPTLERLEREEDINQITDYFSYEHFYVIYCKFWEIDRDHDCLIENVDLARHNGGAISTRVIERIFAPGSVIRHRRADNKMTYSDFVWFLMAEEDKRHPTSIEYWFRCLDVDGDGFLSYQELEHFYDEQCQSMEARGIDPIPFTDMLCQLIDMLAPRQGTCLSLSDLKRNASMTPAVLDTFVNVEKYLEMEQRDGVNALRVESEDGFSDWERFAAVEYEQLVEEEQANSTVAVVRSAGDGIVDSDKLSESLRSDSDEPVVPILIDHHQLLSE